MDLFFLGRTAMFFLCLIFFLFSSFFFWEGVEVKNFWNLSPRAICWGLGIKIENWIGGKAKASGILPFYKLRKRNQEEIVYVVENQSKAHSHYIPQSTLYNSAWQIEFIMDLSFSETIWSTTKLQSHIGRIRTEYEEWQEIFPQILPRTSIHTSIYEMPLLEIIQMHNLHCKFRHNMVISD